jgi:hypothetical protein
MRSLLLCLVVLAAPAAAQTAADSSGAGRSGRGFSPAAPAAAEPCPYAECALRIEPEFFGAPRIVRGADGRPVGRLGLFSTDLSDAVADNEVAYGYAREYERARVPALALGIVGGVLIAYSSLYYQINTAGFLDGPAHRREVLPAAALAVGTGLGIAGGVVQIRANRAQSRAVWEYNGPLGR